MPSEADTLKAELVSRGLVGSISDASYAYLQSQVGPAPTKSTADLMVLYNGPKYGAGLDVPFDGGSPGLGTFKQEALKLNPYVLWMLDEPSGSVAVDSTPNARDGAISGVSQYRNNTYLNDGSGHSAMRFNGAGGTVVRSHETWMNVGTMSAVAWILPYVTGGLGNIVVIDEAGVTSDIAWRVRRNTTEIDAFYQGDPTAVNTGPGTIAVAGYMVVWTHSGTEERIYLNNVLKDTAVATPIPFPKAGALRIAKLSTAIEQFDGVIGPVGIFPGALTPAQIDILWRAGRGLP